MPQFDLSTYFSQIFWLLICFICFVSIVVGVYLPKLLNILNKRDQHISDDQILIKQYKEELEHLRADRQKKITDAKTQAHHMMSETLNQLELKQIQQLKRFENEIAAQLLEFEQSLQFKKNKIEQDIDYQVTYLTEKILEKILHQKPSSSNNKAPNG